MKPEVLQGLLSTWWVSAALFAALLGVRSIIVGRLLHPSIAPKRTVGFVAIRLQIISFFYSMVPYLVYLLVHDDMHIGVQTWYEQHSLLSSSILIVITVLTLAMMIWHDRKYYHYYPSKRQPEGYELKSTETNSAEVHSEQCSQSTDFTEC